MLRDAERVSNLARERAASLSEKSKEVEELKDQLQQAATAKEVCVCARARACLRACVRICVSGTSV